MKSHWYFWGYKVKDGTHDKQIIVRGINRSSTIIFPFKETENKNIMIIDFRKISKAQYDEMNDCFDNSM